MIMKRSLVHLSDADLNRSITDHAALFENCLGY